MLGAMSAAPPSPAHGSLVQARHGDGDLPLVMIHGFTVDHHLLLPLESAFGAQSRWRRIYLDLPGFGASPARRPVSADSIAEQALAQLDEEVGGGPFALFGNSFGGRIARHLAALRADRLLGLGLLVPAVRAHHDRRLPVHQVFEDTLGIPADADPSLLAEFDAVAVRRTPDSWQQFLEHVARGLLAYDREAADELLEHYELSVDPESRTARRDQPGLMVVGRQDAMVGWRDQVDLLEHYPHMELVVADRAGHNAHLDRPELVLRAVRDWTTRMEAALG